MVQFPHPKRLMTLISRGGNNAAAADGTMDNTEMNGNANGDAEYSKDEKMQGVDSPRVTENGHANNTATANSTASELAMVLDRTNSEGDDEDGVEEIPNEELERVAREEEEKRKKFDFILERGWEQWEAETDMQLVKEALVRVLREVGGRGVSTSDSTNESKMETDNGDPDSMETIGIGRKRGRDDAVSSAGNRDADSKHEGEIENGNPLGGSLKEQETSSLDHFWERSKYIPMRLTSEERKLLRLVEATLSVSEYTDQVDVRLYSRMKTRGRIHKQLRDICSILTGLVVSCDYRKGQELVQDRDFAHNEAFFKSSFEIARRHKVANPEKMRSTYGKLVHMLQDSTKEEIVRLLEFTCVKPMITVSSFLKQRNGLKLLEDTLVDDATREIKPPGKGRSRHLVQKEIKHKERAVEILAKKYGNRNTLSSDDVRRCLYSIGDNNAYLRVSRDPCDVMIHYLKKYFGGKDAAVNKNTTLAILSGRGGARLTHDHKRQYTYVHQSLLLWREVLHEMYRLWYFAESDLLSSSNPYLLKDTGQGLNRVQAAPKVASAMRTIIRRVQSKLGSWVGSSVVHLGDHNVPNALIFLDKYAQVPRILLPITNCIRRLEDVIREDVTVKKYVEQHFGDIEGARRVILRDFFRHAFDGSGADNFFDAGSCIDGRLTSCWNWCSSLEMKRYHPLFLLTGFVGFDGEWQ